MIFSNNIVLYAGLLWLFSWSNSEDQTNQWTRFRGSDGSGIDSNWETPIQIDYSSLKWEITLPGKGNSSPVVWGNKIFVSSSDDEKYTGYAIAIDDRDGTILWQKEFNVPELSLHVDNKLATSTPTVDESQVYFIWCSKEKTSLIALSHDGELKWETIFDGIISRHGGGNSLMLTDKYVLFTREQEDISALKGSWVAVEKHSGKVAWELERESVKANSFSTPILVELDNQPPQLIFASQAHGLTSVDPKTGQVLWERNGLLPARVVASPIYSEGLIVACCKGETVIFDINPLAGQLADTAMYLLPRSLSPYVPTPIVVGENLYSFMDNGTVACIVLKTGELLWKERPAGPIFGSPICVAGNLYCMTKKGEVIIIRAGSSYQLVGIHELGDGSFSTPVMCKSGMAFRTFTKVLLFGNS